MKPVLKAPVRKTTRARVRGVIAVELAIILPFLVLLLLGVVELGLLIRDHQVIQNAAREGARYSALPKNWIDERNPDGDEETIRQLVLDYCTRERVPVSPAAVTIDQNHLIVMEGSAARASRVTIDHTRNFLTPGMMLLFGDSATVRGEGVFRNLY